MSPAQIGRRTFPSDQANQVVELRRPFLFCASYFAFREDRVKYRNAIASGRVWFRIDPTLPR